MKRERGVALLVAVLLVALATLIVASLIDVTDLGFARTRNLLREQQAFAYARGLELWAIDGLQRDLNEDQGVDSVGDVWARELPSLEVPGGRVGGRLRERNGCFNLNQLVVNGNENPIARRRFERLLRALKLNPDLADVVIDYLDADGDPGRRGAEDMAYLFADPPRRVANQAIVHVSELRLLRGFDAQSYELLQAHVCAHPETSTINLNTATAPVLMSLVEQLDETRARQLNDDGKARMASLDTFNAKLAQLGLVLDGGAQGLGVSSDQFLAEAIVELDGIPFRYFSRIVREQQGSRVVYRGRGSD